MGYLEKYTGYENYFGLFHNFEWTQKLSNPAITFTNSNPSFIGINNYAPTTQLDVSGNTLFRNNVTISGNITNTELNNNTNNITTNNTKLSKVAYDSARNHTIIGNARSTSSLTRITGGALVQHEPAPIFNKTNVSDYFGNGYYFNTNSTYRTDIINYSGDATASATNGGFDFWVGNGFFTPRNIASISVSGNLTLSGSISTSSFVNIGSRINIGAFQSTTISGNIALSFPLNEYIMVDTTSGIPTFILPNTASLSTSVGCAFHIRRVAGAFSISFTSATGNQISNSTNNTVASLSGITHLNIKFMLFNKLWYFSSYA
jgi:hypothetical protein